MLKKEVIGDSEHLSLWTDGEIDTLAVEKRWEPTPVTKYTVKMSLLTWMGDTREQSEANSGDGERTPRRVTRAGAGRHKRPRTD